MTALDVLAVVIVLLVPFNVAVAGFLMWLTHRHPDLPTLRSRARMQVVLAIAAAIGGCFGLVHLDGVHLDADLFTVLLVLLLLLVSVPGINWTYSYLRGFV